MAKASLMMFDKKIEYFQKKLNFGEDIAFD